VQIAYLAIILAQLFMIALSATLLFGIFKVKTATETVRRNNGDTLFLLT
jgi:hypothetical protein